MTVRKIALMHQEFGKLDGHNCGECYHFHREFYRGKKYRKCDVYGLTNSEASDWAKSYPACGCFNKEWHGKNVIELVKHSSKKGFDFPLEGQTKMEV